MTDHALPPVAVRTTYEAPALPREFAERGYETVSAPTPVRDPIVDAYVAREQTRLTASVVAAGAGALGGAIGGAATGRRLVGGPRAYVGALVGGVVGAAIVGLAGFHASRALVPSVDPGRMQEYSFERPPTSRERAESIQEWATLRQDESDALEDTTDRTALSDDERHRFYGEAAVIKINDPGPVHAGGISRDGVTQWEARYDEDAKPIPVASLEDGVRTARTAMLESPDRDRVWAHWPRAVVETEDGKYHVATLRIPSMSNGYLSDPPSPQASFNMQVLDPNIKALVTEHGVFRTEAE